MRRCTGEVHVRKQEQPGRRQLMWPPLALCLPPSPPAEAAGGRPQAAAGGLLRPAGACM